jgi:hypothetical protein
MTSSETLLELVAAVALGVSLVVVAALLKVENTVGAETVDESETLRSK